MKQMNKFIKRSFILLILVGTQWGCKRDFLDVKPVSRELEINYYRNEAQAYEALVSVYDALQWNDQSGFTMFRMLLNVASDECAAGGSDASDQPSWVAWDQFKANPNLGPQAGFWKKNYRGIYRANLFLEKINQIPDASPAFKTRTIAEAKCLRAKFYMDLLQLFGRVPLITKTLLPSEYYTVKQENPDVIFAQIEKDLLEAIPDLPLATAVSSAELGRLTQGAAQALLARGYLYMNRSDKMADVAKLCEEVINSNAYDLEKNYGDIFKPSGEFGKESVFEIAYSENARSDWGSFGTGWGEGNVAIQFVGMRDYNGPLFAPGWGFAPVNKSLADLLRGDPRFAHTIIEADTISGGSYSKGYQNTGFFIRKYAPIAANKASDGEPALNWGNNVREIRFADVLLMAAEGLVRSGGSDAKAQGYLNRVRSRVGLSAITSTGNLLLLDIYKERQLELATEGHRFFDLVRTDQASGVLSAQGFMKGVSEFLPIPQNEIDASQGTITQNKGY